MCNTTCNNHSHKEYDVDYVVDEKMLDIEEIDVPCDHQLTVYVVQDAEENNQCDCNKCSTCEPKKVSCRSLACQQLENKCDCDKCNKTRKTTMVNVLENDLLRLQDKVDTGCDSMHSNIEELIDNIDLIYSELKDEEARSELQEAFLHYGLDKTVTRAEYNPDDNRIHFYHLNPQNCLNTNIEGGCNCECCNACGCECKCNDDECQSDIPYTMDDDCNIIPMSRDEVELPFTIDCSGFINVVDKNPTLVFGEQHEVANIGGTTIHVTMPQLNPDDFKPSVTNHNPVLTTTATNIAKIGDTEISAKIPNGVSNVTKDGNTLKVSYLSGNPTTILLPEPQGADGNDYVTSGRVENNVLTLTRQSGATVPINLPKFVTNITQDGDKVTFSWSDNSTPTVITVGGGGTSLWKHVDDYIIPVEENRKVYGAGFYDTTVN